MDSEQYRKQDEELMHLAIAAQQHPPRSKERQRALTKLLQKIQLIRRLCRPVRPQHAEHYSEIYEIALQKLFLEICQQIDNYHPERGPVMRWANFLLEKRCFNQAVAEYYGNKKLQVEYFEDESSIPDINTEKKPLLSEEVRSYIETDPENICRSFHHPTFTNLNFQDLAQRRLNGQKWKDISAELNIKISTLSDFYQRSLKEIAPKIKLYLHH